MATKVQEAVHPLQRGPTHIKGGRGSLPAYSQPLSVHCQFLSLADVQDQVGILTPALQVLYCLLLGVFVVICDQAHHRHKLARPLIS